MYFFFSRDFIKPVTYFSAHASKLNLNDLSETQQHCCVFLKRICWSVQVLNPAQTMQIKKKLSFMIVLVRLYKHDDHVTLWVVINIRLYDSPDELKTCPGLYIIHVQ